MKALAIVAVVVGLLVAAALKFGAAEALADLLQPDPVQRARAGDCLTELPQVSGMEERTVRDVAVVDCGTAEAAYTVVGRVPDQTQEQARSGKACEQFVAPGQDGYVFYNIASGERGYLLCLTKKG
ncbi:porin [Micromonospora sp. KC606]|nr:porin [Micromonospora sp. KC606]